MSNLNATSTTAVSSPTSSVLPSPSASSSDPANSISSSATAHTSSFTSNILSSSSVISTSAPEITSSSTPSPSSSTPLTTAPPVISTVLSTVISTDSNGQNTDPYTVLVTSTLQNTSPAPAPASATSTSTSSAAPSLNDGNSSNGSGGLSQSGKTAIAVVVPVVGVALIALAILFFWRRRKQRKDAEELRRKEVEEYGFNPNNDPTLPAVGLKGGTVSDGPFPMSEEGSGYRGWGNTTTAASSGRKASTTLSGGAAGGRAYSDGTSPSQVGPVSDARSGEPLIGTPAGRPLSGETEVLGAMGPAAAGNRGGDMHRGPSNASSSYSAGARSDGSGEQAVPGGAYGAAQFYQNEAGGNYAPYPDGRVEAASQPVIRDNLARRATRIENPSHFPTQASAGISQNF